MKNIRMPTVVGLIKAENVMPQVTSADAGKLATVDSNGKWAAVELEVGQGEVAVDNTLLVSGAAADAKVTGDKVNELKSALTNVDEKIDDLPIVYFDYVPTVTWVTGLVINGTSILTKASDQVSNPIFLPEGASVTIKTKGDGSYFFSPIVSAPYYQDISSGKSVTSALATRTTGTAMQTFTYTAQSDMYIMLCSLTDDSTEVTFSGYPERIALSINSDAVIDFSNVGNTLFDDAGTWIISNNSAGSYIPTYPNTKYRIKAKSARGAWCSFVTALGVKGGSVAYATGSNKINFAAGEERIISAPADAQYLYIGRKGSGNDITPDVFKIINFADNILVGKKLAVDGDSICSGAGWAGGYAKLIGQNNAMVVQNKGVGGGTIASGTGKHIICESMQTLDTDADYILIEGGVNDASYSVPAGSLASSFTDTFDTTTFAGAIEKICETLVTRFAGKKYGFIIPHRMSDAMYDGGSYYAVALQAFKKWGVPYLDLSKVIPSFVKLGNSGVQELVDVQDAYTADTASSGHGDGWHPNKEGYLKYYVPKIEAWMMTL